LDTNQYSPISKLDDMAVPMSQTDSKGKCHKAADQSLDRAEQVFAMIALGQVAHADVRRLIDPI
jgi:hypothetical protein